MNLATFGAIVGVAIAMAGGYASSIWFIVSRIDRRLDRLGDDLRGLRSDLTHLTDEVHGLRTDLAAIGQRLDDHITNHPGPTRQLAQP